MPSSPTAPDGPLAAAVLLGWRVAELYALVDDTGMPASDTLLPAHGSLEPADQLELQLRAACGDARRAGVTSDGADLDALVALARTAPGSPAAAEAFRTQLRSCHIEVQKDLWALDEAAGKAYELGNGLSDTYGRVCRAYRRDDEEPSETWAAGLPARAHRAPQAAARRPAVAPQRGRRGGGARPARRLVRGRAGAPQDRRGAVGAAACATACGARPSSGASCWRATRRRRPTSTATPAPGCATTCGGSSGGATGAGRSCSAAALFVLALALPHLISAYETGFVRTGLASALVAVAGAVGITKVSILLTVRGRLDQWSQLLWDRALAQRVVEATLTLDSVLPPPARRARAYGVLSSGGAAAADGSSAWGRPWSNSTSTSVEGIGRA